MTEEEIDILADKVAARVLAHTRPQLPELLTMRDVIKILGIGRRKVLKLLAEDKIRLASAPGQKYRFYKSQILNYER